MPFARPTLTQLRTQAMQDITASDLPKADGFLRRSALRVLAWVQAGLAHLHYGYLDWIAEQATPFTSTGEFLEAWAALAPTPVLRLAPQFSGGSVLFPAVARSDLPAGTQMIRGDGAQFQTVGDAVASGNSVTATIVALVAGSGGNSDLGISFTLSTTLAGITSIGAAVTAIVGGADVEMDDPFRARMLESYANPPAGGDAADYVTWALTTVPSVTRAWCLPLGAGAGTVVLYFMMDVAQALHSGFPQGTTGGATLEHRIPAATGDQLTVANAVYPRRPVTALLYLVAPTPQVTAFTISGLAAATSFQQAAVRAAIDAVMVTKANPLGTSSINQSDIDGAISSVAGLPGFAVTLPASWPITPSVGSLLTRGTTLFV